jgi:hypothetical protein
MWRLFIILVFLITSFTFITSAHSRLPADESSNSLSCPSDSVVDQVIIFEPTLKKNLIFNCRLKEKNEFIIIKENTKTLAMAYKVENKLYLNSLNVFKDNKLVEFRKYSTDQTLQKWEIFSENEKPFYIYSLGASRLEIFDTETGVPTRNCSFDVEANELINIEYQGEYILATKVKNTSEEKNQIISFHLSKKDAPEKFIHQEIKLNSKYELELKTCLKSKITPINFSGEVTFINQKFDIPLDKAIEKQDLIELIKKEGQDIIDFFNSLGQEQL